MGYNSADSSVPKINLQGTVRAEFAEKTWQRLAPMLELFEITRIADITGLDCLGIPVAQAIRPNGCALTGSQGKGISPLLAKISAAMESIELYHAETLPESDVVTSYATLIRNHQAINPALLEPGKYGASYSSDRPIAWIQGKNLFDDQPVYVPKAYLDLNTTTEADDAHLFSASSNGLASGNHLIEAISHGLLEVIERDCQWRFQRSLFHRRLRCLVDPDTITSPLLCGFLAQIRQAGATVALMDITSALGVPAYSCAIGDSQGWHRSVVGLGWGCHPSKEVALSRAITEAAQSRVTTIAGSRDDILPERYASSEEQSYRSPSPPAAQPPFSVPQLNFEQQPQLPPQDTFEADLKQILGCLQANGFHQAVVVNHTRAEYGIPVVHVIVPGMRFGIH
jgi:YcaO-like protein with predicted kinase domain